jgi:hypothetical protein
MKTALELLPAQETGRQTDFTHEQQYDSLANAHAAFLKAAGRMLSVRNWHNYTGAGSAIFTLCNNQGEALEVMAGPGPDAGDAWNG